MSAQPVTPARERHLRALGSLSTQLHRHLQTLGESIRTRSDEQRHTGDNVRELEAELESIRREERFGGVTMTTDLRGNRERVEAKLRREQERDAELAAEIDTLKRQEAAVAEAQQRCGGLVEAVLRSFGPAGNDVGRRLRGKA